MPELTLVTGNPGKLAEWRRLFPSDFKLASADLQLDEIQSLDLDAIVSDKARRAYARLGSPVIVEDVSAGLVKLNGLPGPFIKFFEIALGTNALFQLANKTGEAAVVSAVIAYYDGSMTITAHGEVAGTVVAARGENGFGFDHCFVPNGSHKTFAQMSPAEKDALSHRSLAIKDLVAQLKQL